MQYVQSNRLADIVFARKMLIGLEDYYPDFDYWFVNKCIPGIVTGNDTLVLAKNKSGIVGVAIGKKTDTETKLRCVRVLPSYQNSGAGIHLIDKTLRLLDCDKPYCTVSESMIHQFSRPFINYFNFSLTQVHKGLYKPGVLEYAFN